MEINLEVSTLSDLMSCENCSKELTTVKDPVCKNNKYNASTYFWKIFLFLILFQILKIKDYLTAREYATKYDKKDYVEMIDKVNS